MIPLPSPVEGFAIEHDVSGSRWRLSADASTTILRPWTWGERRRLLAASIANGTLDRSVFVRGLFDLLLDGPVPHVAPASLALVCLSLLGVPEDGPALPLSRAELLVATHLGWLPQQIDTQPADDIDRLIAQIQPDAGTIVDDGWTRIVIAGDGSSSIDRRLESMLTTLSRLAGLSDAGVRDTSTVAASRDTTPPAAPLETPSRIVQPQAEESQPTELTFGGVARIRARNSRDEQKGNVAWPPTLPAPERPFDSSAAFPVAEARIARVSSRVLAGGEDVLSARPSPPPDPGPSLPAQSHPRSSYPGIVDPSNGESIPLAPAAATAVRRVPFGNPVAMQARVVPAETPAEPAAARLDEHFDAAPTDVFPAFRATVSWSDAAISRRHDALSPSSDPALDAPFALSDLEEQIADLLERAVREAGIDLP